MSAEQPKVIKGYVTMGTEQDRQGVWLFRDRVTSTPAQLVLTSEPLYTESQVRAMVEEALMHLANMFDGFDFHSGIGKPEAALSENAWNFLRSARVTDRSGTPQRGTTEEYSGEPDPKGHAQTQSNQGS